VPERDEQKRATTDPIENEEDVEWQGVVSTFTGGKQEKDFVRCVGAICRAITVVEKLTTIDATFSGCKNGCVSTSINIIKNIKKWTLFLVSISTQKTSSREDETSSSWFGRLLPFFLLLILGRLAHGHGQG
jgi:hypothetical protein